MASRGKLTFTDQQVGYAVAAATLFLHTNGVQKPSSQWQIEALNLWYELDHDTKQLKALRRLRGEGEETTIAILDTEHRIVYQAIEGSSMLPWLVNTTLVILRSLALSDNTQRCTLSDGQKSLEFTAVNGELTYSGRDTIPTSFRSSSAPGAPRPS